MQEKQIRRNKIHKKIRMKIVGTKDCPRLCVFKSANHIYAQLIDDENGKVLVSASDIKIKKGNSTSHKTSTFSKTSADKSKGQRKINHSIDIGKLIAKEALAKKIEKVTFDRGGFVFHGRIKAVADGARQGGLKF